MFDHIGVAVSDLAASERFYRTVLSALGREPSYAGADNVGWGDWWIGPPSETHPVPVSGLHVGFRAADRDAVDAFWDAGVAAGFQEDGIPGLRREYGPDYYGAYLRDPDNNSVEAVHYARDRAVPAGCVDHLVLRVDDPHASGRFYETIAPHAGFSTGGFTSDQVFFRGEDFLFALLRDGQPATQNVHLAFTADTNAKVHGFHAAALAAGYSDNGAPGPRPNYHGGYYSAFVHDPNGFNVEVVNHASDAA